MKMSLNFSLVLFWGLFLIPSSVLSLEFAKIFSDGMVLQSEPFMANVWGSYLEGGIITLTISCDSGYVGEKQAEVADGNFWQVTLDPLVENDQCNIEVAQNDVKISLSKVLIGDVYVCSGQSNMEWAMNKIFNATEEIAASASYDNIRMYHVPHIYSDVEQDEFMNTDWAQWEMPNNAQKLGVFSAVCFLYAREISDKMGRKPLGLIESNWGGTRIEPWMSPDALNACNVEDNVDANNPQQSNSVLYNAMIRPMIRMTIKAALWYQGESNTGWNRDLYQCTFPAMINDWRDKWSEFSHADPMFPFGFVQLGTIKLGNPGLSYPIVRWHQTADQGYVPNDIMQNVFMAVAMDTYDEQSGIHPRNKQLVTKRLAAAGMNVVYEDKSYPTNGPIPNDVKLNDNSPVTVNVMYDQTYSYKPTEITGFYACCSDVPDQCAVTSSSGPWTKIESAGVINDSSSATITIIIPDCENKASLGIAYLWEETPVAATMGFPFYANDEYQLPSAPWIRVLK